MAILAARYTVTIAPRGDHRHLFRKPLGPRVVRPRNEELIRIAEEQVPRLAVQTEDDEQEFSIRLYRRSNPSKKAVRIKSLHFYLTPQRDGIDLKRA